MMESTWKHLQITRFRGNVFVLSWREGRPRGDWKVLMTATEEGLQKWFRVVTQYPDRPRNWSGVGIPALQRKRFLYLFLVLKSLGEKYGYIESSFGEADTYFYGSGWGRYPKVLRGDPI